ncbi:MAG: hypothetical protein ACKVRO_07855 [Micropepsaceae bacterium]
MPRELWLFVAVLIGMVAWRLWGDRVVRAVRAHDQRRIDADLQAYVDRMNPNAHFRQSVDQLNETTPPIELRKDGSIIWMDQEFETREEAEAARWRHVVTQARDFYHDLDRNLGHKIRGPQR